MVAPKTSENLKTVLAGESQAYRKYLRFSEKAQEEGLTQIAKLFKAAAAGEAVHSGRYLKNLELVGSTADNLKAAMAGEDYEFETMYREMIDDAAAEDESQIKRFFEWVRHVENEHSQLFGAALAAIGENQEADYYVCSNCGHLHVGEAPDECPVCGWPKSAFNKVEL